MFGGLEIKSNKDEADEEAIVTPALSSSAFGFINAGVATSTSQGPASAAPASSFSFLNVDSAPTAEEGSAPAPFGVSGFSFILPPTSSLDASASLPVTRSETQTVETSVPVFSSGSHFSIPSPSNEIVETKDAVHSGNVPVSDEISLANAATSAFSFLSSPPSSTDVSDPPLFPTNDLPEMIIRNITHGSASSSVVSAPSPTPPNILDTPTLLSSTNGLPTGTGITFGTSAKRNVVKKKKTRVTRIGAGATGTLPVPPAATPVPSPAAVSMALSVESKSARDEAIEAAKRAEEFMQNKVIEEAKASPVRAMPPVSSAPPDLGPSNSSDSVLAAAQKAAEEAKVLQQQQQHQKGGGFIGTFFKGFRGSPNTTGGIIGSSTSSLPPVGQDAASHRSPNTTAGIIGSSTSSLPPIGQDAASHPTTTNLSISEPTIKPSQCFTPAIQEDDDDDNDDNGMISSMETGSQEPNSVLEGSVATSAFSPVSVPSAEVRKIEMASKTLSSFTHSKPIQIKNFIVPEIQTPSSLPVPIKSKTPIQIFEEYQALFAESVHRAMKQVENVRSQQKMLFEERFVSLAKDRLATQQIEQTEQQLQLAVEEEEYELADQLGQVVEGHKREKHEVGLMLENISKALAQLNSQKELVVQNVATCFDNLAVRLEELKEKEAANEQKDDEETLKQYASISKQLSAEQERLQQDLKHLERDELLVSDERKELEDAIKEQTGEIEQRKSHTSKKLEEVQNEIDELRRQIDSKQKEAADLRTQMFGFDDTISKVRVKFSRQLIRVDKKERALKESRSDWELEQSMHKRQKEAHELQMQSHSEALLAHDALMTSLTSELRLAKEFCELIPSQLGFMDQTMTSEDEGNEGDLAQLQADVVKCEAAVSEAKILLKAANTVHMNLQIERDSLIASIPRLESMKKDAASKRDFKSASKASREIKEATARIKECIDELSGEAESKKKAAEEELARLDAELVQTRELANEKEKVAGLENMASLARKIAQLVGKKKVVCGESISGENSVKGVGALVLEGQIEALKTEGHNLGSKYGGWLELMKDYHIDDDVSSLAVEEHRQNVSATQPAHDSVAVEVGQPQLDNKLTMEQRVQKVKSLVSKLKLAEENLDSAAAEEDFDRAAGLQETIEALASEIADIDLPEDVLANAVSGDIESEGDVETYATPQVEAVEPTDDEEEKKDTHEECEDYVVEECPPVERPREDLNDQILDVDLVEVATEKSEPLEMVTKDADVKELANGDTDQEGIKEEEEEASAVG
jgi:hypothetical protein